MRTREDIEKQLRIAGRAIDTYASGVAIEVLLDIRELLQKGTNE